MNLDIERTEKTLKRVRSGQVKVIIGVLFFRGLLDWVGLGWVGFLPVRYISHGLLIRNYYIARGEKFANAYIPP